MNKLCNFILKKCRDKTTWLLVCTALLNFFALVLYVNFGTSEFIPNLSSMVIVFMVLGMVLPFAVIFSPLKIPYVVLYAFNLLACFFYLASQASFIANVFVGIDGTTFSVAFYAIVVFTLASAVLSLLAMSFVKEKI